MNREIKISFTNGELDFLNFIMKQYTFTDKLTAASIRNKLEEKLNELAEINHKCKYCKGTGWMLIAPKTIKSCPHCDSIL